MRVLLLLLPLLLLACPISGPVDGIGTACTVDGDACPLDHTCVPDDKEDPKAGLCAPIQDYGACPPPGYAQVVPEVKEEDLVVDAAADLTLLENVATVKGNVKVEAPGAGGLLALGDLCGFSGLQHVDEALLMTETDATSLDGLQGVAFAGKGVLINGNINLVDVIGLKNVAFAPPTGDRDGGIVIANNRDLEEPAIDALREALSETAPTLKIFECGNRDSPIETCPNLNDFFE